MALTINTNLFSLTAQKNLRRSESPLETAMQRLSSGLRVNSAKDDAAGMAIGTRMSTQVRALTVAIRNANDGISITQTAEGAIDEMTNSLQRMYELAEQAASYNSNTDRGSLNNEVSQLIEELNRVVGQTRYNGEKLFSGNFSADIQVGTEVSETINVKIGNLDTNKMGVATNYTAVTSLSDTALATQIGKAYLATAISATAQIEGYALGATFGSGTIASTKVDAINALTANTGMTAFTYGNGFVGNTYAATGNIATTTALDAGVLSINGISIDAVAYAGSTNGALVTDLVSAINSKSAQTGVTAIIVSSSLNAATDSAIVLVNRTGAAISVSANTVADADIASYFSGATSVGLGANGAIVLNDKLLDTSVSYDAIATNKAITGATVASTTLTDKTLNQVAVTSVSEANLAMLAIKNSIDNINVERSVLGAKQNRVESVIRNVENVRLNIEAARSRIMDADYSAETASLTKSLIVQQAGISILSQANQIPQQVLALLGR